MSDGTRIGRDISRREAIRTAVKAGAYSAPLILSATTARPALAQVTGPTNTLSGVITDATTRGPLEGVRVSVQTGLTYHTFTNAAGAYALNNVPSGSQSVHLWKDRYGWVREHRVTIAATGVTTFSAALDRALSARLSWGFTSIALALHVTGPNNAGGRFHATRSDNQPVPYVLLVPAQGPNQNDEFYVSSVTGLFIPGVYRFVAELLGTPPFVAIYHHFTLHGTDGTQLTGLDPGAATGDRSNRYWHVCDGTLGADGTMAVTPVNVCTTVFPG